MPFDIIFKNANITDESISYISDIGVKDGIISEIGNLNDDAETILNIDNLDLIPYNKKIIVICHHGVRSANVVAFLMQNGFKYVYNLTGGIDKYAIEIDKTIKRY